MALVEQELEDQLREAGNRLLNPPYAVRELLPLIDQVEDCLSRVEQSPSESMLIALRPSWKALITKALLRHSDTDVKVAVASCISEITRITAPEAPYDDELMKEIFQMIVAAFEKLYDIASPSYSKRISILETVAKVRSCVVMLDLECDDLILEMFNHFTKAIRENHPDTIFSSMETIMTLVLEESEDISPELLSFLLSCVQKESQDILPIARRLGEKVIGNCAAKIKPYLMQEVKSLSIALDDYSEIVASIYEDTIDAQEHNNLDARGQHLGTNKMEPEVACPGEVDPTVDKSPIAVLSNGIVLGSDGNSLGPSSPEKKLDPSHLSCLSETTVATTEGEPDHLDTSKIVELETVQDEATKKKRGQKTSSLTHSTDTSDHSRLECKKETVEWPSRKRGRRKETDNSVSEGSSVKDVPSDNEKRPGFSSPTGSLNEIASPSPSLSDATRRKRGRPAAKKNEGANAEVSLHGSPPGQMETISSDHIVDEACQSTYIKSKKESEGSSDMEAKMQRCSTKKVGAGSATVGEKAPITDNNSKKESEDMSDSEVKPLRRSGKKVRGGNSNESESSAKQRGEQPKQQRGTARNEKTVIRELKKKMPASPKSATKVLIKDESNLEETPKTALKRKRVTSTEKASENLSPAKGLDESIIGRKIKVWWPDDEMFYHGKVVSFDPVKKEHKIVYDDGDEETLLLKNERWECIDSVTDEEKSSDLPSPDASEMLRKKILKATSDSSTKQAKTDSLLKRGRGASAEKHKGDGTKRVSKADDNASKSRSKSKSDAIKLGNKSKEGTPKTGSKSKDNISSKSKEGTPKIGSKSKDNISSKSKEGTPKTGSKSEDNTSNKSMDDSSKTADKSKEETPKAAGQSMDDNAKMSNKVNGASAKGKSSSLRSKVSKDFGKAKSGSTMQHESEVHSSKKRAQESGSKSLKKTAQESGSKSGKKTAQESETKSGKKRWGKHQG